MHIDLDNFQRVYCEKVKPLEEELEKSKQSVRLKIAGIIILAVVIEIYITSTLFNSLMYSGNGSMNMFVFVIFGALVASTAVIRNFTKKAKIAIFPALFKSIDENIVYDGTVKRPVDEFRDSELYTTLGSCRCVSEDNITTKVNNKEVVIYELDVETGSGKHRRTVFNGLFLNMKLDTPLKSDMKIVYNTTKDFGIIKTLFANDQKVNLENIDFEEKYDVYCADQIYARKIITLTFMEKLLYATNKLKRQIQITFKNDNIYIAISGLQLINDSALYSQKIDMLNIAKELDNILGIIETVDYLNLDEKIV